MTALQEPTRNAKEFADLLGMTIVKFRSEVKAGKIPEATLVSGFRTPSYHWKLSVVNAFIKGRP